jgi:hypothetical protein
VRGACGQEDGGQLGRCVIARVTGSSKLTKRCGSLSGSPCNRFASGRVQRGQAHDVYSNCSKLSGSRTSTSCSLMRALLLFRILQM